MELLLKEDIEESIIEPGFYTFEGEVAWMLVDNYIV